MGRLFQQALQLARDRQSLLDNQRLWLIQRDSRCGVVADTAIWSCLLEETKSRANSLANAIATAAETPPVAQPAQASATATLQNRATPLLVEPRVALRNHQHQAVRATIAH